MESAIWDIALASRDSYRYHKKIDHIYTTWYGVVVPYMKKLIKRMNNFLC